MSEIALVDRVICAAARAWENDGEVLATGIGLVFSPLAGFLQLQALPLGYFPWLVLILAGYMVLTQCVKGWFVRRYGWQ
mgnify:CR=1 FL=1